MAKTTSSTPSHREIIQDIKKGKYAPIYLLSGSEPYYLDLIVAHLEDSVMEEEDRDFDYEVFYGADTEVKSVIASAQQYPMMASHRLVVFKETQAMTRASAQLDTMEGYALRPNDSTILVIVYKGDELKLTSKLSKAVKKSGGVVFQSPKIKEYRLMTPIKEYCQERRIGIDNDAAEMLVSFLGNSLEKIFGEIDKLLIAGGKEITRISRGMVLENIGLNKEFNAYELQKAMANKDYTRVMTILDYFASNPRQNPVAIAVSVIFKFFAQLTVALFNADKSERGLMDALNFKEAWRLTDIHDGMRNYNARQAVAAISRLRRLDCNSKGIESAQNDQDLLRDALFEILTAR